MSARSPWQIQRAVLYAIIVRELQTRFGGRWLGAIWFVLEPLAHVLLLLAVFGFLHRRVAPGMPYPVFLVTGLLPFFAFRSVATRLMDAVDANRGLFAYRQVKPMDAFVSRALLELGLYSTVYIVTLALLAWIGFDALPARPLEMLGILAALIVFGVALGVIFAVATDEVPQLRPFVRMAFFPLYFLSGVIFPVRAIPPEYIPLLLWNPLLHFVELARAFFFERYALLPGIDHGYALAWPVFSLALALALYRARRLRLVAVG